MSAAVDASGDAFLNYGDIFSQVVEDAESDPILHIVVLTYECDEKQLLSLAGGRSFEEEGGFRRARLKTLADIRPVVVFDARKSRPYSTLPQFLELYPFKTPAYTCHHSKAYLIVTERRVRLAIGSFNLTETGLFRNREAFETWIWQAGGSDDINILADFTELLRAHYLPRIQSSAASALADTLQTLRARLATFAPGAERHRLIPSGYGNSSTLERLASLWREWHPGVHPDSLLVVSPFFDESPQHGCAADDWLKHFPSLSAIEFVTDERSLANLSRAHFGSVQKGAAVYSIPEEIGDGERRQLEAQGGGRMKDRVITRPLHAKIVLLWSRAGGGFSYVGSANFSRKAWGGENLELGVVERVTVPEQLRGLVMRSLCVDDGRNRFPDLPSVPPESPPSEDDEGYRDDSGFPGFIDCVLLEISPGRSAVHFRIVASDLGPLSRYEMNWSGHRLEFTSGISQSIARGEFENALLAGRTVEFRLKNAPDRVYWFPFQYSEEIVAERETILHRTTMDWLAFYLGFEQDDVGDEMIPGASGNIGAESDHRILDVDRAANPVIAMQRYLGLFARVERAFLEKVLALETVVERDAMLRIFANRIGEPLRGLADLVCRETEGQPADRLFKLGELKLLMVRLREQADAVLQPAIADILASLAKLLERVECEDRNASEYLGFLRKQGDEG